MELTAIMRFEVEQEGVYVCFGFSGIENYLPECLRLHWEGNIRWRDIFKFIF